MKKSLKVWFVAVFAAFHAVLYFLSPPILWRSWAIYLEPIEGIILGPEAGFYAALLGSIVGRTIKPTEPTLLIFGVVAEPLGVLICALLVRGKWRSAMPIYAVMLAAYFIHPFGRWLPIWTVLDTLLAFFLIYPAGKIGKWVFKGDFWRFSVSLIVISFICIATDALVRVFLLVPSGLYTLFTSSPDVVYAMFVLGAIDSYIEDALVVIVSFVVGVPLVLALRKIPNIEFL
jgi:hypothetical protein